MQTSDMEMQVQRQIVPVSYNEPELTITPMNAVEHLLVDQLKNSRRRQISQQDCRICLENGQEMSKMVVPCRCTGSIEFVHEHCMIEWVKRRLEMDPKKKPSCEVCSAQFRYRQCNRRFFDTSMMSKHCQRQRKELTCFFICYAFFILLLLTMIVLTAGGRSDSSFFLYSFISQSSGMTIMVSVMVIMSLGIIVVTILFISEYFVKEDIVITKVLNYYEPKVVKNKKVYFRRR